MFRGVAYLLTVANFDLTEINNILKCLARVCDYLKVRTLGRRGIWKACKSLRGEGDP